MKMLDFKWMPAAVMAATLITACGGRPGDQPASGLGGSPVVSPTAVVDTPPGDISTSVVALLNYVRQLFSFDGNGDPVDINGTALAVDDSGEPDPVTF